MSFSSSSSSLSLFAYKWIIDWNKDSIDASTARSEDLNFPSYEKTNWFLTAYVPEKEEKEGVQWASLYLDMNEPEDVEVKAKVTISVNDDPKYTRTVTSKFNVDTDYEWENLCPSSLLKEKKAFVSVSILIQDVVQLDDPLLDFQKLFKNQIMTDVLIKVNGEEEDEEIGAHKAFLAARSSVFGAMFQPNSQDNQTNVIQIENLNMKTTKKMLDFIYKGNHKKLKLGFDLLDAAEKYDLKGLKTLCEEHLGRTLTCDNAIERLIDADKFKAIKLRKTVVSFIVKKAKKMRKSKSWREMMYKRPDLMDEILGQFIDK